MDVSLCDGVLPAVRLLRPEGGRLGGTRLGELRPDRLRRAGRHVPGLPADADRPENLRPTVASSYNYVQPLVATLVAVSLGMDTFGWLKGVAVLLVFAGVYIVTISKSRAQLEAEAGRGSASR